MKLDLTLNKEEVDGLYWDKGLSLAKIANKFNIGVTALVNRMDKFGIKRRPEYKRHLPLNKETLEDLYINHKLSLSQLGEKFNCNSTNILYWLKKFKIPRRPAYKKYIHIPKELLEDLYINKKLSTLKIAKQIGVINDRTIRKKLKRFGIKTRSLSESLTKKFRKSFSGNLKKKSYLLGLRAGDFHAKKQDQTVRIQTTTTHLAQINLLKQSFERYGEICTYLSKNKAREDEWFIYTDLDESFNFLINKPTQIPEWVLNNEKYFYSFLAAYMDCEGTWNIIKSHKNSVRFIFRIGSGDFEILKQIRSKLISLNYTAHMYLDTPNGTASKFGKYNRDIHNIILYRKSEVIKLIKNLLPLSKHSEKIRKMRYVLNNKENNSWKNMIREWKEIKEEINGELLKNQLEIER